MRILLLTAFITVLLGGVCLGLGYIGFERNTVEGSGRIVTEDRSVGDVREVDLSGGNFHLVISQAAAGAEPSLKITSDDNIVEKIKTEMDGGQLEIRYDRDGIRGAWRVEPTQDILIELSVTDLSRIEVSGSGDVEADQISGKNLALDLNGSADVVLTNLDVDTLSVDVNGSADLDVDGRADTQEIEISGSGKYRAGELVSRTATIDISGSGRATVNASDSLDVDISGSGRVEYYGVPKITQDISGSGELRQLEPAQTAPTEATPAATPSAATPVATPRPSASPRALLRPAATKVATPD